MPPRQQQFMQQQQQNPQQQGNPGNNGMASGSWQSEKDMPHRREMIQHM
jgi:hypothetical protein